MPETGNAGIVFLLRVLLWLWRLPEQVTQVVPQAARARDISPLSSGKVLPTSGYDMLCLVNVDRLCIILCLRVCLWEPILFCISKVARRNV